jgi:hypothetical protein
MPQAAFLVAYPVCYYGVMVFGSFLSWWYGEGWRSVMPRTGRTLSRMARQFSLGQVLSTLFAPWKQDMVHGQGSPEAVMKALLLNVVSRLIGFFIRLGLLVFALGTMLVLALGGLLLAAVWPILPFSFLVLFWLGMRP